MADTPRVISLTCPNCGGKLEISPDMTRFACGYCGAEQVVQRRGGTVSLQPIAAAIEKVSAGTDRVAAELAIQRLQGELAGFLGQREAIQAKQHESGKAVLGCGFLSLIAGTLALGFGVLTSLGGAQTTWVIELVGILGIAFAAVCIWASFRSPDVSDLNAKIERTQQSIARNRAKVR